MIRPYDKSYCVHCTKIVDFDTWNAEHKLAQCKPVVSYWNHIDFKVLMSEQRDAAAAKFDTTDYKLPIAAYCWY